MKKLLLLMIVTACTLAVSAQDKTTVVKDETKTKHTTTAGQKVHNTFSKNKKYSGKKTTHKKEVETKTTK